jgi:hypothetical protein
MNRMNEQTSFFGTLPVTREADFINSVEEQLNVGQG